MSVDFLIEDNILKEYLGDGGNVVIPTGVTTIGKFCFIKCDPHQANSVELESVQLPDTLVKIEAFAFANCWNLTEIIIPEGVTEIGDHAFEKCQNLEKVILPQSLLRIGDYAFSSCIISELELPQGVTSIGEGGLMNNRMKEIKLPDNIENISKKAFDGQLYAFFKMHVKKGSVTEKVATQYSKKSKTEISLYE